jgi:hypothetical protein
MHPDASAGMTVDLRVEVRPGWLAPATWGLLVAGAVLIVLGMATLAWPTRRPSFARPATLADVLPAPAAPPTVPFERTRPGWAAPTPMPVRPILAWPPHPSVTITPSPLPAPLSTAVQEPEHPSPASPVRPTHRDLDDVDLPNPESEPVPDPAPMEAEPVGPDLPGSADLASALGAPGVKSRSTRRRKTAAGLPSDSAGPPPVSPPLARRRRD